MYIDIELDSRDLAILQQGGFLSVCEPNGIEIVIRKNSYEFEENNHGKETK